MTITMTRDLRGFHLDYRFREAPNYIGIGNCTLGIFLQSLTLKEANSEGALCLRQTNLLLRLLEILTLHMIERTPYHFQQGGVRMGILRRIPFRAQCRMSLGEDSYVLEKETGERYTWSKNGAKIALYKKEPGSMMEQHRYTIEIEEGAKDELSLCFLVAMAIDVIFYPNRGRVSGGKIVRTYRLWQ